MSDLNRTLFMTAADLAGEADCTTERVEELARAGIIPGLKWGRSWRFVRADAPGFLAEIARAEAEERRSKRHQPTTAAPVKRPRRAAPPALPFVRPAA
jgi:hypothetical protein